MRSIHAARAMLQRAAIAFANPPSNPIAFGLLAAELELAAVQFVIVSVNGRIVGGSQPQEEN